MYQFIWNIVVSYLVLFLVVSIFLHLYSKEQSFKYYGLYNFTLVVYLLTKNETVYNLFLEHLSVVFNPLDATRFTIFFNWFIQVVFYNFYFIFSIYFLDLEKHIPILTKRIKITLLLLFLLFTVLFWLTFKLDKFEIFFNFFQFLYLPAVLSLFIYSLPKAIKYSGKHKYIFLVGLFIYIIFALLGFYLSIYSKMQSPLVFFLIGIMIENFCFAFGLTYKSILVYNDLQKVKSELVFEKQNQEIAKLEALIDGEEKERVRIAQELHDGLNGDLAAIKFRLSSIDESDLSTSDAENFSKVTKMIDESCALVRSISHNLMPSSILEYGLIESIKAYCNKINNSDNFTIAFQIFGDHIALSKKSETVIYRIIQEMVTNILKHSKASEAMIQFNYRKDELFITVEDNGIGFDKNSISNGIGHKNIKTRIDFLNAQLDVDSSTVGTSYTISIDLNTVK